MIKKFLNLIIYLIRYYTSIQLLNYNVKKNINFGSKKTNKFFITTLKKSNYYLEYGSGSSSLIAKKLKKKFLTIETDKSFFTFMSKTKRINKIIYSDLGPTKYYSIPILPPKLIKDKIVNYANQIENFYKKYKKKPDFILIDGRFRVYVTAIIIKFLLTHQNNSTSIILIDDFDQRKNYHVLKKIIKINLVGRMGFIKINQNSKINKKNLSLVLKKFILDYN